MEFGHDDFEGTPEDWAHCLVKFGERLAQGELLEATMVKYKRNMILCKELQQLLEEVHMSPSPQPLNDSMDPSRSIHIQRVPSESTANSMAPTQEDRQEEERQSTSAILWCLNLTDGLFDQPAAQMVGLSACCRANSVPRTFETWGQLQRPLGPLPQLNNTRPPPQATSTRPWANTISTEDMLCYINKTALENNDQRTTPAAAQTTHPCPPPKPTFRRNPPPHFDLCNPLQPPMQARLP